MENIIIVAILVAIAVGVVLYLLRARKRGKKCISCSYADQCSSRCNGGCSNPERKIQ